MIQVTTSTPDLFSGTVEITARCQWQKEAKRTKCFVMPGDVESVSVDMARNKVVEVLTSLMLWREKANESYGAFSEKQLFAIEKIKTNLKQLNTITDLIKFGQYTLESVLPHLVVLMPNRNEEAQKTFKYRLNEIENFCVKMENNCCYFSQKNMKS